MIKKLIFITLFMTLASGAKAEDGVTATEITIGSSGDLVGNAKQYGQGMVNGAKAFYEYLNANGGVNGRKIKYLPLNDAYDSRTAVLNVIQLAEKDKMFAFVTGAGTPATKAILPVLEKYNIPWFFGYSGGDFLHDPTVQHRAYTTRIPFSQEHSEMMDLLVNKLKKTKFAIFYQSDAYGQFGRDAARVALEKLNITVLRSASYSHENEINITDAVDSIISAKPEVVVLEGQSIACSNFVKEADKKGFHPIYAGPSPVGALVMAKLIGNIKYELYISEVVPNPLDTKIPLVKEYQTRMKGIGISDFTPESLEGYIGAKVFVEAVKRVKGELTRANLIKSIESISDYNLGGLHVSFSPTRNGGFDHPFMMKVVNGKVSQLKK